MSRTKLYPLRAELCGPPAAPVVVALGGISADEHVCANSLDPSPGWWENVVGPGRGIDTNRFRVFSIAYGDSGAGDDGRPGQVHFTTAQAMLLSRALDDAGIVHVHAVVGASYGGMVGLSFAQHFAERLSRLVVISAPHRSHPRTTALRWVQRQIVELGIETGRTHDALSLARALATITYRSAAEFAERFAPAAVDANLAPAIPVVPYLRHQGEKFAASFPAHRFLELSLSCDVHTVEPEVITTPTWIVAAENDEVVPREQLIELATRLGGPTRFVDLPSKHGHDAFLLEPDVLNTLLAAALGSAAEELAA